MDQNWSLGPATTGSMQKPEQTTTLRGLYVDDLPRTNKESLRGRLKNKYE